MRQLAVMFGLMLLNSACSPEFGSTITAGNGLQGDDDGGVVEISVDFDAVASAEHLHDEYLTEVTASEPLFANRDGNSIEIALDPATLSFREHEHRWNDILDVPNDLVDGDDNSGGTVTTIESGEGLLGGPITETGTLSIDFDAVARASHDHPTLSLDLEAASVRIATLTDSVATLTDIVAALTDRIDVLESAETLLDSRIDSLEELDLSSRLDALEAADLMTRVDEIEVRLDEYEDGTTWPLAIGTVVRRQTFRWFGLPPDAIARISSWPHWTGFSRYTSSFGSMGSHGIEWPSDGTRHRYRLLVYYTIQAPEAYNSLELRIGCLDGTIITDDLPIEFAVNSSTTHIYAGYSDSFFGIPGCSHPVLQARVRRDVGPEAVAYIYAVDLIVEDVVQ